MRTAYGSLEEFAQSAEDSAVWWAGQAEWHKETTGDMLRYWDCREMEAWQRMNAAQYRRKIAELGEEQA